jgi:MFS family permease
MVPPHLLSRAIGIVVGAANVGGALGFLASGLLVDWFSPAAIFWFLFVFGIVLAAGVYALVAESPVRTRVSLDLVGAALLAAGLVALLLAISKGEQWRWASARVVGLFAGAALLFAAFALAEHRVRRPLLDLALIARRPFVNTNACALTFGFAFFLAVYLLPQIAASPSASGYGLELSTTHIGLMLLPTSVVGFGAGWLSGRLIDRVGSAVLVVTASAFAIAAYALLAASHDTVAALVLGSAAVGIGWGAIPTSFYPVVLRRADADKAAVSVSVPLVFRNIGASLGVTVAFVVLESGGLAGPFRDDDAFVRGFIFAAAATALVFLAGLFLPRPRPASQ